MNTKLIIGLVILILVGTGGFLLLSSNSTTAPAVPQETIQPQPTAMEEKMPASSDSAMEGSEMMVVQEITISGEEFKFTPPALTVKKGQKVKLVFKNAGKFPHDFAIEELNIKTKTIQGGQEDTIEFTADKAGSFAYVCTVGDHEEKGMTGKIIVTE